jgi:thiol:disulfide interchange protein DsbD
MTADWCITCKVNEQVALTSNDVIDALAQEGVVYIVGDWTNKNTEILEYLSQYERAGVPLYVVYAGNQKGKVLPQILTPNMVINAINTAKEDLQKCNSKTRLAYYSLGYWLACRLPLRLKLQ